MVAIAIPCYRCKWNSSQWSNFAFKSRRTRATFIEYEHLAIGVEEADVIGVI